MIVIDNSRGSLEASDPYQNPREPQTPWLKDALAGARARGIPAIVVGSRDLNSRFQPSLNVATDADDEAQLLVDGGASAYFFERPEENRVYAIPSGGATTIPAFGTGTLGYRSAIANTTAGPDSVFGDAGLLLAEVDTAKRDPATNRAPVVVRLLPVVSDLTLQAVDGTLLRRSRPSLFAGLGPSRGRRRSLGRLDRRRRPAAARRGSVQRRSRRSRAGERRARRGSPPSTSSAPRLRTSATSSRRTRRRRTSASR